MKLLWIIFLSVWFASRLGRGRLDDFGYDRLSPWPGPAPATRPTQRGRRSL